jgi:arsenate reductase-like glutaredoxin family protein
LLAKGAELELRDLGVDRLTAEELDGLIGDRDYRMFLNTRNDLFRKHDMANHPPSRAEAIAWMAREPNLIRRPVVISGRRMVLGYDQPALLQLAGAAAAPAKGRKKKSK